MHLTCIHPASALCICPLHLPPASALHLPCIFPALHPACRISPPWPTQRTRHQRKSQLAIAAEPGQVLLIVGSLTYSNHAPYPMRCRLNVQDQHPLHPPFDLDANSPTDAYPRSGLIPDTVWDAIPTDKLTAELKGKGLKAMEETPELWPAWVLKPLQALPSAKQVPGSQEVGLVGCGGAPYLVFPRLSSPCLPCLPSPPPPMPLHSVSHPTPRHPP